MEDQAFPVAVVECQRLEAAMKSIRILDNTNASKSNIPVQVAEVVE